MADQCAHMANRESGVRVAVHQTPPGLLELDVVTLWESRLALVEQAAAFDDTPQARVALASARAELAVARARVAADLANCEVARFASCGGGR